MAEVRLRGYRDRILSRYGGILRTEHNETTGAHGVVANTPLWRNLAPRTANPKKKAVFFNLTGVPGTVILSRMNRDGKIKKKKKKAQRKKERIKQSGYLH